MTHSPPCTRKNWWLLHIVVLYRIFPTFTDRLQVVAVSAFDRKVIIQVTWWEKKTCVQAIVD